MAKLTWGEQRYGSGVYTRCDPLSVSVTWTTDGGRGYEVRIGAHVLPEKFQSMELGVDAAEGYLTRMVRAMATRLGLGVSDG